MLSAYKPHMQAQSGNMPSLITLTLPHLLSRSHTQNMHPCCHFAPCSARLHYKLSLVLLPIKWPGNLGRYFSPSLHSPLSLSAFLSLCWFFYYLIPFSLPPPQLPFSFSSSSVLCLPVFPTSQALFQLLVSYLLSFSL